MKELETLLASAARTATVAATAVARPEHRGVIVIIDVTAIDATPSVVYTIQGYNPTSDDYYTILASAAVVATGQTVLRVYPGLTPTPNLVANDVLPINWRVNCVHGDADSMTYSVTAILLD